uniref:cGMP-dependent protein kinase n=1 Tax=Alexandrium catenella TaxID=2925 RepID=A0A7S1QAA8_ALECA
MDGTEVVTLGSGDYFGENALLYDEPRTATVQASSKISALKVSRAKFDEQHLRDKLEFRKRQAVGGGDIQEDDGSIRPPSAKTAEEAALMREALQKNTNLQTMVNLSGPWLTQLIESAWKESVPAGKELITEGDLSADHFYIVQSGGFTVVRQDAQPHGIYERISCVSEAAEAAEVGEANPGDTFGELALLYFAPRAATVTARTDSVVWVIHRAHFKAVLAMSQKETVEDYKKYLGQVKELSSLLADEQEQVAKSLTEMSFARDEEIFTQGEKGRDFYILVEGEVAVIKDGKRVSLLTATRDRSQCFGEKALLNDAPRAATIKVTSDKAKALTLDKATFDRLLGPLAAIQKRGRKGNSMVRDLGIDLDLTATGRTFGNICLQDIKKLGVLGCGGFGCVELREHMKTGETYALKGLSKGYVVKCRLQKSVLMEKNVQLMCDCPFIIKLYETFNSEQMLYLLLELALGGELYATYNKKNLWGRDDCAKFYVAGTTLAFYHMHSKKIIFRDLKPENLLLNEKGQVKLTDMGLAKVAVGKTYTTCGTPDYFAPEVIASKGHTHAVDWWTLGILIFEMIVGYPPFVDEDPMGIYQKILSGKIVFPKLFDKNAKTLVKKLLTADLGKRYGNLKAGVDDIKMHKWFREISWADLLEKRLPAPFKPSVKSETDTSNFDDYPDSTDTPPAVPAAQDPFVKW